MSKPKVQEVWITIFETDTERTQRKVKAVRIQGGLAVTPAVRQDGRAWWYVITHLATGKRLTQPMPKAIALGLLAEVLQIAEWSLERPMVSRADWDRLGLTSAEKGTPPMIEAKLDHKQMVYSVTDGDTVLCDVRNIVKQEHVGTRHQYPCTDIEATRKRAEHIAEALRHYQQSQEGYRVP